MIDVNALTLIVTFLLPLVIQFIKRFIPSITDNGMQVLVGIVSLVTCLAVELATNPVISLGDLVVRFPAVFLAAQLFYDKIWYGSKVAVLLEGQK